MSRFEVGRSYRCASTDGQFPVFYDSKIAVDKLTLQDYDEDNIRIRDGGLLYKYQRHILTFKVGSLYTCITDGPIIVLEGIKYMHLNTIKLSELNLCKMLREIFNEYNIPTYAHTERSLLHMCRHELKQKQLETKDDVMNFLNEILLSYCRPCSDENDRPRFEVCRDVICRTLVPIDADTIIGLADWNVLPGNLKISWVKGRPPRVILPDGTTLVTWLRSFSKPVGEELG